MNKIIKPIASAMIAILIFALVLTFLSYYDTNVFNDTIEFPSGEKSVSTLNIISGDYISNNQTTLPKNKEGLIESIINNSPEIESKNELPIDNNSGDNEKISGDSNINNSGDTDMSGDDKPENNITGNSIPENNIPDTIIEIPDNENAGQLVISSDPQTSNQEKQEILTEIDEALKGLLEVVGKVEIVDEDRLNASLNSEVDKP